ncbi:efflux RND transporter periplasmic adaptor subunit [Paenibacillus daejeonensis]|uniref:efflux RND transporter periplasmic adaptor subunit n=1 Tax=Paenibacillus daejeonensis TaxID=135193 RepID=UPI000375E40D|nr:HlyD family efflux transporter periplasmic adaptor subunit [Paenibacillus daejeonensis]
MKSQEEETNLGRQRFVRILFIVFILTLILFTLFSNTLQSLTLPKVRTDRIAEGALTHKLEAQAMLEPLVEVELMNPSEWEVQEVLVEEGQRVSKGQPLVSYNDDAAQREIQDQMKETSEFDLRVRSLQREHETGELNLKSMQEQFIQANHEGEDEQIRRVAREMETQKLRLREIQEQMETSIQEEGQRKERIQRDIQTHTLDLDMQERKIEALNEKIAHSSEIKAPFDGHITRVYVQGNTYASGQPDLVIADYSEGFKMEVPVDAALASSLELAQGQQLQVEIIDKVQQVRSVEGEITHISKAAILSGESDSGPMAVQQKHLTIKVKVDELEGGEQGTIKLEKRSRHQGLVLPNQAIHQASESRFIYKVIEARGPLGNRFVAQKVQLKILETDGEISVVHSDLLYPGDQVIMESSEPLQDGNRIRLQ